MSSLEAGAWIWRPPSPFQVVYFKEILEIVKHRLRGEERRFLIALIDGNEEEDIAKLENLSAETVYKIIRQARNELQIEIWDSYDDVQWQDLAGHGSRDD